MKSGIWPPFDPKVIFCNDWTIKNDSGCVSGCTRAATDTEGFNYTFAIIYETVGQYLGIVQPPNNEFLKLLMLS